MEKYSSYKDSGFAWMGQIPSHWGLLKSKFLWRESFDTSATGTEDLLSVSQYDGVTPANGSRSESLVGYKVVQENNLVINIMLAWMGGLGVSAYNGLVSPAYCVYKLQGDNNPKYMHYLYKTPMYLAEFARHSTGVIPSRWRMYTDDFGQVLTLIPPRKEQDAMVEYLDAATAKIDEAIAQQQCIIDLLNERKQIIIGHAVSKGLHNDVLLKESGFDWIGLIPSHWKVIKTSYVFTHIGSGTTPSSGREDYYSEDGFYFLQTGDLNDGYIKDTSRKITEKALKEVGLKVYPKGSLVIAMYGATIGKLGILDIDTTVNQACCVLPETPSMDTRYAFYLFSAAKNDLIQQSKGGGQPNISQDTIRNERIIVPPLKEQIEIAKFIDSVCIPINTAISNANLLIERLQERKQIIINEVVTGKVKVD